MKIATKLRSDVIERAIHAIAKTFGHVIVDDSEIADAIITNDLRQMVSMLKRDKRVVQFLISPSEEPATGLMTAYPELFTACRVVPGKGIDGCEMLIIFLATHAPKEQS